MDQTKADFAEIQEFLQRDGVTNKHSLLQKQLLLSLYYESQDYHNHPRILRCLGSFNIIEYGIDRKRKL